MRSIPFVISLALLFISGCQYTVPEYGETAHNNPVENATTETITTDLISWSGVVSSIDDDLNLHLETAAPDIPHKEIALAAIEVPLVKDHLLSKEVQQFLTDLLVAKTVRIELDLKDIKNNEIPKAFIYIDDMRVQDILVRSGLAFINGENTLYTSHLIKLQEEAIKQFEDIWTNQSPGLSDALLKGLEENLFETIESRKN
ncbi:thermonuclease family protein [Lysinibacillus fusiformis]|uniref:thermonuclease family protein n=1 Tax=Lysinibacillus fusiformis TaxID=28031 RepID=UPI0021C1CF39|nr:thermonuclease family protein [Lysinibacillus fusiformis]UXJ71364.1 thermonuclease family protein [Lysinibacillus fusiformis]